MATLDTPFEIISAAVAREVLPSGVLAVADAERVLRLEAYGPVEKPDSIFLIASITKPIVATAVMRLVEEGQLLLNECVTRLIPEFDVNGKDDVRVWHLLTHTSGLDENWISLNGGDPARADWQQMLNAVGHAPLQFRPGSRYAYCNPSYFLLAELIRRATGREYAEVLNDLVLEPLEMRDTSFTPPESRRVATVHDPPWSDDGERANWIRLRNPSGGLWSTASDLVRFGQMLLHRGAPVLSPAAFTAMTSLHTEGLPNVTPSGTYASYYALGYSKSGPHGERGPSHELRSHEGFGHGGATGTYLWVEPALELVFVFLSNRWATDDDTFRRALNATIAWRSRTLSTRTETRPQPT
ncbi:MAG: beta-lactamase family protein [Chloroflexi bacterium]|nr:beta-lactamase family protein [Chloroflexota bacterium]